MNKNTQGSILLFGSLILYVAYWVVLLVSIQDKYASTGNYPPLIGCLIAAIIFGLVASTGTYVGNALKKDKAFGIEHTSFSWGQLFSSTAYRLYSIVWITATVLFTILWRNDL